MPTIEHQVLDGAKKVVKKKIKKVIKKKKEVTTITENNEKIKKENIKEVEHTEMTFKSKKIPDSEEESTKNRSVFIEKPSDANTSEGVPTVVSIRLANISSILGGSLNVTWIKGKWNELTKGDRYEMWSKENPSQGIEHFLKFKQPKTTDTGTYRVKVVSPNGEEEKFFNVNVTPAAVEEKKIEIVKKGKQIEEVTQQKDVDFRNRLKKVERSKRSDKSNSGDFWSLLRKAKTKKEYENISFKFGICDMRSMLRRVNRLNKTIGKNMIKSKAFNKRLPETHSALIGDKLLFEVEVTNDLMTVKWERDGTELVPDQDYQIINKGSKRSLVIKNASSVDNSVITCAVGSDVTSCEVFVQTPPTTIVKGFDDCQIACGSTAHFSCKISNEKGSFKVLKDGGHLIFTDKVNLKQDKDVITLQISEVEVGDEGFYELITNGGSTCAELIVHEFQKEDEEINSSALKVNFQDEAEIFCEVKESDKGEWTKNDIPLEEEKERIKMIQDGKERKLVISQIRDSDCGEYSYIVTSNDSSEKMANPTSNIGVCISPSADKDIKIPPVKIILESEDKEPSKVYLDCNDLKQVVKVKAGCKLSMKFPSEKPENISLKKDGKVITIESKEEGEEIKSFYDNGSQNIHFIIDNIQTKNSGEYAIILNDVNKSEETNLKEICFVVKVVDVPLAPSKPIISKITPESCQVNWDPPKNAEDITGYIVERRKTFSNSWIRINTSIYEPCEMKVTRLIENIEYQIRVSACNQVGVGKASDASDPFVPLGKCNPPASLRVSSTTDDSVSLVWRAPADTQTNTIAGYQVFYSKLF